MITLALAALFFAAAAPTEVVDPANAPPIATPDAVTEVPAPAGSAVPPYPVPVDAKMPASERSVWLVAAAGGCGGALTGCGIPFGMSGVGAGAALTALLVGGTEVIGNDPFDAATGRRVVGASLGGAVGAVTGAFVAGFAAPIVLLETEVVKSPASLGPGLQLAAAFIVGGAVGGALGGGGGAVLGRWIVE